MQLFLYRDTKDDIIHASVNQKITGCRVRLKNAAQFTQAGVEDFSELMDFLDRVNCQKCQDCFTPKILKADAKAMKQRLKAEKKGISYEESAPAPEPERRREPAPAPVQQAPPPPPPAPVAPEPEPQPEPPAYQAPDLDDSALPQYEEWTPPTKKKEPEPAPAPSANGLDVDDSLAQFMLGKQEDPTAAAFASDNSPNPNALAGQQTPDHNATGLLDDTLAQFAIPGTNPVNPAPKPAPIPAPSVPEQASGLMDDMLAQFAIPGTNQANPAPKPAPVSAPSVPEQASGLMDDMLAQFAIPGTNPATPPAMQTLDTPSPAQQTAPKPVQISGIDDILAEFGQKPSEKEEETLDELFAKFNEEKKQSAQNTQPIQPAQPVAQPSAGIPGIAGLSDLGNLEVPQLNGMNYNANYNTNQNPASIAPPAPAVAKPAPAVSKNTMLMGELDEISMAPKVENKEEEEEDYMSLVVNTRLEDYDDDDDDDDDDYDDYYDDDEEEYHGSSYAPQDDSDDAEIDDTSEEDYEIEEPDDYDEEDISYRNFKKPQQPVKSQEKASQVTAEDIQAATAAITAAAAAITAAAAKAPASVPDLDLPDLSGLGIPDVPALNIPGVPDIPGVPGVPEVPGVPDLPGMSDLPDLSRISSVPDLPSNPFEADANADIPEVPTLSNDEPDYMDPLQSVMPMNPMGYQPGYPGGYQQPVQPGMYGNQMYQQPQSSVYLQPQQPMYAQPHTPAPAVHTAQPAYGNASTSSVQFHQLQPKQPQQPPQQPVSQGVRVSTIGQKTVVPDAVRNAIAKTAAQSNENIFDQQGKKVHIATDITSALSQMGEDTSSYNKPQKEENEPVVQGYKEWKPKEDKKLANFKKGLNKKF